MTLSSIPVLGWVLDFVFKVSMAIPFWICWTVFGIGKKFFYFVPEVYYKIGFWECVGIFFVLSVIGSFVKILSPFNVGSNTTQNNNTKKSEE